MAASTITVRPTALQIARAAAAAMPAQVSTKPLLGILGVVTGAGVVTLTSRMISLGMPDFRGFHGFGYDESAWIGSAFDAGLKKRNLAPLSAGLINVTYTYLTDPALPGPISIEVKQGSSQYWLALLEMYKQGLIDLRQPTNFAELRVAWVGPAEQDGGAVAERAAAGVEDYQG